MRWQSYFFLATRLAFSHRGSNLMSIVIITTLSLLPLIVTLEVADGMTEGIITRYLETNSYHFRVSRSYGIPTPQELLEVAAKIEEDPRVIAVVPETQSFAMAFSTLARQGILLRGVPQNFYEKDSKLKDFLSFSAGGPQLDLETVVIGHSLARNLNLKVGDNLKLLTVLDSSKIPRIRTFKVGGIFSVGYHELDKSWVFVDNRSEVFLDHAQTANFFLGVKVHDPFKDIEKQKELLQSLVPTGWLVLDWQNMNYATIENFRTTTLMLLFVLGLIVCVAIVSNTGALHNFFLSRRKDIALIKAMGAQPKNIGNIFLGLGFVAGLCGAVLGITIGVVIALNINNIILMMETIINFFDMVFYGQKQALGRESFYLEKTNIQVRFSEILLVGVVVVVWSTIVNYFCARKVAHSRVLSILNKI